MLLLRIIKLSKFKNRGTIISDSGLPEYIKEIYEYEKDTYYRG